MSIDRKGAVRLRPNNKAREKFVFARDKVKGKKPEPLSPGTRK